MSISPGWRIRRFRCEHCQGGGTKWSYTEEGPEDCCCNGGVEYIGPSGKLFVYPGGPFLGGSATAEEIAASEPFIEEQP